MEASIEERTRDLLLTRHMLCRLSYKDINHSLPKAHKTTMGVFLERGDTPPQGKKIFTGLFCKKWGLQHRVLFFWQNFFRQKKWDVQLVRLDFPWPRAGKKVVLQLVMDWFFYFFLIFGASTRYCWNSFVQKHGIWTYSSWWIAFFYAKNREFWRTPRDGLDFEMVTYSSWSAIFFDFFFYDFERTPRDGLGFCNKKIKNDVQLLCCCCCWRKITKFDVQLVMVWYFWEPIFCKNVDEKSWYEVWFPQNPGIFMKYRGLGPNSPQNLGISRKYRDLGPNSPQNLGILMKYRDLGPNSPQNLGISMKYRDLGEFSSESWDFEDIPRYRAEFSAEYWDFDDIPRFGAEFSAESWDFDEIPRFGAEFSAEYWDFDEIVRFGGEISAESWAEISL